MVFTPGPDGIVPGWLFLVICRVLVGVGNAGIYTIDLPLVQEFIPAYKRGWVSALAGCGKSRDFGKTVMKRARNRSPGLIKSTGYDGAKGDESGWKHHRPTFSAAC